MRVVPLNPATDVPAKASTSTIGKYRVIETIGRGAMGVVYKARDPEIGRDVAIKLLRSMQSAHPQDAADAFKRFRLEARSAGNLRHPNIITIFEANQENDRPYIVMEYVRGEGLDQIIARERRLVPARALAVFRQIAAGLDYAHTKGVVHCDIKPSNILVEGNERVLILDFGVASMSKRLAGAVPLPAHDPEIIVGTPAYMSPEQIRNETLDGRSDLFSFTALTFECLTGKIPFLGDTATGLMRNIIAGKRRPLGSVAPDLPVELEFVFDRAFSIDKNKRFSTAQEFVAELEKAFGMTSQATPSVHAEAAPLSLRGKSGPTHSPHEQPHAKQSLNERVDSPKSSPNGRESAQRIAAEDMFAPRSSNRSKSIKPGTMFEGGAPPALRRPKSESKPQRSLASRFGSDKIMIFAVGVFLTPISFGLAFFLLQGASSEGTAQAATATTAIEIQRPSELESELVAPRIEESPTSAPLPELSNRQLLGVIVRGSTSEQRLLEALTLAADRRLTEFVDASVTPLQHPSATIRFATIKLLGNTGDRRIVPHLVVTLEDPDERVRVAAARALAELGDRRALGFLSARYLVEKDSAAQSALKRAIEQLSGLPLSEPNLINHIRISHR